MLLKKLVELNRFEALEKIKDLEKVVEGVSKVINIMKDFKKISEQHIIESKFYNDDDLHRICKLLGGNSFTRRLSINCLDNLEDEALRNGVIYFLENDMETVIKGNLVV